jgi:anti-sigma-K factor RskA
VIRLDDAEERAAAVGEYVLGTLSPSDHAAFEAALANDRSLQAEVYRWQDRMLGLTALAPSAAPSEALWSRIENAVDRSSGRPPRDAPLPGTSRAATGWWRRLAFWQGLSFAAVLASLMLALLLVVRVGVPEAPAARYVAVLQSPDGRATGYVVEVVASRTVRLVPVGPAVEVPAGRALQFWTKPEGAAGPTSLGLVRPGEVTELPASRLPAVGARQLFEVTLEPEGGSPLDRPTGPILYVGTTVSL